MSALATILMAAMLVPANGPEKVSGEVEERLDLSGEWEGTSTNGSLSGVVRLVKDKATEYVPASKCSIAFKVIDEGGGRMRIPHWRRELLGIYRYQDSDHVIICVNQHGPRPQSYRCGDGQALLILHRVKPRK